MKKNLLKIGSFAASLVPLSAMAQISLSLSGGNLDSTSASAFITSAITMINTKIIPVIIALAFIVFLWGVFLFVKNADNDTERKKGREFIFWGLIGLFVMFSVWGLIYFLSTTFGLNNTYRPTPPTLQ